MRRLVINFSGLLQKPINGASPDSSHLDAGLQSSFIVQGESAERTFFLGKIYSLWGDDIFRTDVEY